MKKLLSFILVITLTLTAAISASAFGTEGVFQKAKLKVGINAQFPPFEYRDENGELVGFDIDLMNLIGDKTGFDIEFVDMPFDKLFESVVSGDVACVISAISITEERNNVIDYTIPYLSAKVTYIDGETTSTSIDNYAIVFPNNSAEKGKVYEAAGESEQSVYKLVNNAISAFVEDKTIEKLGEKYNLNKASDTADYDYEYTVLPVPNDFDKTNMDESELSSVGNTSATSVSCSQWAIADIKKAEELKIINYGGNYNFPGAITREEFCELIYNLIVNHSKMDLPPVTDTKPFADTHSEKIKSLYSWGIITGKGEYTKGTVVSSDGTKKTYPALTVIAPNDHLTREEAATIIIRMVNKFFPMAATELWFEYDDIKEVSSWALNSVQTISNLGFMTGVGENKFAPQDTYTTEQAIATIVRVYDAQASGSEAAGEADVPAKFVVKDNIKLNKFYVDEAINLTVEAGECAADREFIVYYTSNEEMLERVLELGAADYSNPKEIYYMSIDKEKMKESITSALGSEAVNYDIEKLLVLNKVNFANLAALINSSYGSDNFAALTILTNAQGYIMPKDFKNDFALYLEYEGDYGAIVSFSEFGEGVISATMSFVKKGEKDNVFSRLYEISQGFGEDCIIAARVSY